MRKLIALLTSLLFFVASCAHTVSITTEPEGARVKVNDSFVGQTPCTFTETTGSGRSYQFIVEKEGYKRVVRTQSQTDTNSGVVVGSVIGGILILIPFIGLAWMKQLPSNIHYDLRPIEGYVAKPTYVPTATSTLKTETSSVVVGPVVGAKLITAREIVVFSGPSPEYDRLGGIQEGCRIEVKETNEGWCRISCKEYSVGWIQATYLIGSRLEPEPRKIQPAAVIVPEPTATHTDTATLMKKARVYPVPGTTHTAIGSIPAGATIEILEEKKGWYRFSTPLFSAGWIKMELTDKPGEVVKKKQPLNRKKR